MGDLHHVAHWRKVNQNAQNIVIIYCKHKPGEAYYDKYKYAIALYATVRHSRLMWDLHHVAHCFIIHDEKYKYAIALYVTAYS